MILRITVKRQRIHFQLSRGRVGLKRKIRSRVNHGMADRFLVVGVIDADDDVPES